MHFKTILPQKDINELTTLYEVNNELDEKSLK